MRPNLFAGLLSFALVALPTIALAQTTPQRANPFSVPQSEPVAPQQKALQDQRAKLALQPNAKYPETEQLIEPGICLPTPKDMLTFLKVARGMSLAVFGSTVDGSSADAMLYNSDMEWVFIVGNPKGVCIGAVGVNLTPATPPAATQPPASDDNDSEPQAYHQPGCEKRPQGCPETEEQLGRRQQSYRSQAVY